MQLLFWILFILLAILCLGFKGIVAVVGVLGLIILLIIAGIATKFYLDDHPKKKKKFWKGVLWGVIALAFLFVAQYVICNVIYNRNEVEYRHEYHFPDPQVEPEIPDTTMDSLEEDTLTDW